LVAEHRLGSLGDLLHEQRAIHHQPVQRINLLGRNPTDERVYARPVGEVSRLPEVRAASRASPVIW
jgi:hypothetical protein